MEEGGEEEKTESDSDVYGAATISRLLKIIRLCGQYRSLL